MSIWHKGGLVLFALFFWVMGLVGVYEVVSEILPASSSFAPGEEGLSAGTAAAVVGGAGPLVWFTGLKMWMDEQIDKQADRKVKEQEEWMARERAGQREDSDD